MSFVLHTWYQLVDVGSYPNHTPVGPWTPGPLRTEERSEDVTLSRRRTERFTSKSSKNNQRAYVTKNRLVFRQTSKETVEALAQEGPHWGKDVVRLS